MSESNNRRATSEPFTTDSNSLIPAMPSRVPSEVETLAEDADKVKTAEAEPLHGFAPDPTAATTKPETVTKCTKRLRTACCKNCRMIICLTFGIIFASGIGVIIYQLQLHTWLPPPAPSSDSSTTTVSGSQQPSTVTPPPRPLQREIHLTLVSGRHSHWTPIGGEFPRSVGPFVCQTVGSGCEHLLRTNGSQLEINRAGGYKIDVQATFRCPGHVQAGIILRLRVDGNQAREDHQTCGGGRTFRASVKVRLTQPGSRIWIELRSSKAVAVDVLTQPEATSLSIESLD